MTAIPINPIVFISFMGNDTLFFYHTRMILRKVNTNLIFLDNHFKALFF